MKRFDSKIKKARMLTSNAVFLLNKMNEGGKQYDFTNSPHISGDIDALIKNVDAIRILFYQEL